MKRKQDIKTSLYGHSVIILVCSCTSLDQGRLLADTRGHFDLPLPLLIAEYLRKGFFNLHGNPLKPWMFFKAESECRLCVYFTYPWYLYIYIYHVHKVDSDFTPCNLLSHINPTYDVTPCLPLHASCLWQHLLFFSLHIYQGRSELFVTLFLL